MGDRLPEDTVISRTTFAGSKLDGDVIHPKNTMMRIGLTFQTRGLKLVQLVQQTYYDVFDPFSHKRRKCSTIDDKKGKRVDEKQRVVQLTKHEQTGHITFIFPREAIYLICTSVSS